MRLYISKINVDIRSVSFSARQTYKSSLEKPDPNLIKCDYVGPPDKVSNIRPYVRCIPPNETELEKKLRLKRIEVEEWNHFFWLRHNKRFYDEKQDFVRLHNMAGIQELSADKMSEFYKSFLDKNRRLHILYNFSWYFKNFQMLFLAFRVEIVNIFRSIKIIK
ncbi:cytochrome c oxidase assembly factor 8 [Haematobia irritans]|uniref:Putative apopt family protein cg14806 mitochondrial n=1 Tax=Haematobia irritans TaxID=7368 RepID=A0A1L8EIJ3_HAEIR